jgi:hypothetical protein
MEGKKDQREGRQQVEWLSAEHDKFWKKMQNAQKKAIVRIKGRGYGLDDKKKEMRSAVLKCVLVCVPLMEFFGEDMFKKQINIYIVHSMKSAFYLFLFIENTVSQTQDLVLAR